MLRTDEEKPKKGVSIALMGSISRKEESSRYSGLVSLGEYQK